MNRKLWGGRFESGPDTDFMSYQASLPFDIRLFSHDVRGNIAYARALEKAGILSFDELETIVTALESILEEKEDLSGWMEKGYEDVHSLVEAMLYERVGELAGKVHTARSRNDQVLCDMYLYLTEELGRIVLGIGDLIESFLTLAKKYPDRMFPSYTHLQPAQPILFAHYLLSYAESFRKDAVRVESLVEKLKNNFPLGVGAIAGNSVGIDRDFLAKELGFSAPSRNSIETVSQRDEFLESVFCLSLIGIHMSRLSEDLIIFSSSEFGIVQVPEKFTTGSSLMPQKRNPDLLELTRGKSARLVAALNRMQILLKGLPGGYQKDLQEDKLSVFDSIDEVGKLLELLSRLVTGLVPVDDRIDRVLARGQLTATDLADYFVVEKGVPFREAHSRTGKLVAALEKQAKDLNGVTIEELKSLDSDIDDTVMSYIVPRRSIERKTSKGGTSPEEVKVQIEELDAFVSGIRTRFSGK